MGVFDPVELKKLSDRGPVLGSLHDTRLNETNGLIRNINHARVVRFVVVDLAIYLLFGLSSEGRCATEEDISYDTSSPYIDFVVVFSLVAELRRHVKGTAK